MTGNRGTARHEASFYLAGFAYCYVASSFYDFATVSLKLILIISFYTLNRQDKCVILRNISYL